MNRLKCLNVIHGTASRKTVSVEECMNQVQRRLSLTDCWLLALLIQASTHVLNFIRLRLYMNNP